MSKKIRGSVLRVMGALLPFGLIAATAQADGPTISGYVETNYTHNFNNPVSGTNQFRSYDTQDRDINNTAHLEFNGAVGDNVAYSVQADAGSDAGFTAGDATNAGLELQEAFVTYTSASKLGFKVGKFATFEGIEVIE